MIKTFLSFISVSSIEYQLKKMVNAFSFMAN